MYLVGTAHFSKESCEDVRKVIESVQPDIVVIELCKARTNLLQLDDQTILEEVIEYITHCKVNTMICSRLRTLV